MKTVAVIPVKETSERVKNKNFKTFANGLSLLDLKILQLKEAESFDEIFISSNSETAKTAAEKHQINFIQRDDSFCNNITSWSDTIHEVIKGIPVKESTAIAWCHVTSPLFTRYKEAVKDYYTALQNNCDGLVSVCRFSEFLVSAKARPVNYSWGVWHPYSQNLEELYSITGALFITTKKEMLKNRYVISKKHFLFDTKKLESVDIDDNEDFRLAQLIHENLEDILNA